MAYQALGAEALAALVTEAVADGGRFRMVPDGTSMLPLLRPRRDAVSLSRVGEVRRGDILLYRSEKKGLILHRVRRRKKNGRLVLAGDHQGSSDTNVSEEQVLAVVTEIIRDIDSEAPYTLSVKDERYLCYVKKTLRGYPVRRMTYLLRRLAAGVTGLFRKG